MDNTKKANPLTQSCMLSVLMATCYPRTFASKQLVCVTYEKMEVHLVHDTSVLHRDDLKRKLLSTGLRSWCFRIRKTWKARK